jgi:hypothetical protein
VNIIALADGAGSAILSHYGAEQAVNCIAEYLSDNFVSLIENEDGKQVKQQILETVRNSLEKVTEERECKLSDLASTLLVVAVSEDNYIIAHVGDGVIGYLDGEELKIASFPDNGEFSNVTTFVTSKEALASMRLFKGNVKSIAGFVIMSDGTEQSLYHKPTKSLAKATIKLMHRTCLLGNGIIKKQLITTFNSVIAQNTLDDCSIALLVRPIGILRDYTNLGISEKCEVIGLPLHAKNLMKRLDRFDKAVSFLDTPRDLKSIAKHIHLKPKQTAKRLQKLIASGLITRVGALYVKVNNQ